jgi:hypothetical protein
MPAASNSKAIDRRATALHLYQSRTMNRSVGRPYQGPWGAPGRTVREFRDMDENADPARRDQIGARAADRPGELGWGLLLLVWFAGDVVVATLAWFLVSLFLK